jgi:signal transduction histidine kinase
MLLVPLLSLAALWGLTSSNTLGNFIGDQHYDQAVATTQPSLVALEQTLRTERTLSVIWLDTDRQSEQTHAQLLAARRGADVYVAAVRKSATSVSGMLISQAPLDAFLSALADLPALRAAVNAGTETPVAVFTGYTAINTAETSYFRDLPLPDDPNLSLLSQAAIAGNSAEGITDSAIALVDGAFATHGLMTQSERVLFAEVIGQQDLQVGETISLAPPTLKALLGDVFSSPAYDRLVAAEDQIAASPPNRPIPVSPASFQATANAVESAGQTSLPLIGELVVADTARLSDSLLTQLYLTAGLGLAAVLVSVFVALRFGRRLRAELTRLYETARQMADERLPRLVERLRGGEDVDVRAESPPPTASRITEIDSVARAFASVQHTAAEAAIGQASLRKGVNRVFVSMSMRSQSLLHRQLSLLDEMERATSDPTALDGLFRLDHLSTRMRRHAEGLLILAGATPGRGWRGPVSVADVLNAAVAEVEDYVRVDVVTVAADTVAGSAVNDIIHLLAELVENATAFSPPHTRVQITGSLVGTGFAVAIEDCGLGIAAEELARINTQLASPPEFDLANTDQLGLFVTAQLAARHGIRVSLRQSRAGGTKALVLLPHDVIVSADRMEWEARHRGGERLTSPPGLSGRHRLRSGPEPEQANPRREQLVRPQARALVPEPGTPTGNARPSLPQRPHQASLTPQLRDRLGSRSPAVRREDAELPERSPAEAGGLMAALQAGWQRGRRDDLDYPEAGQHDPQPDAFRLQTHSGDHEGET